MKRNVKIIVGIVLAGIVLVAGGFYLTRPVRVKTIAVREGTLAENLQMEGKVIAGETRVIAATTNGIVTDILCRQGERVLAGQELVLVDDSRYQQEIADEIASLKRQKDSLYNQNYRSGLEIKLRQEQLIDTMTAVQHEFDMMFGENGTAYHDTDAAKWAYETAKSTYEAAVNTNDDWEDAKEEHPGTYTGDAPFSGAQLAAYANAMAEAKAAYQSAQQLSSEKNIAYYAAMIQAYQTEFDTLTEMGNYNAKNAGQEASRLQISMDALIRKQTPDKMAATDSGVVSELLVEEGGYVTEYQPLLRIYNTEEIKLEVWMLTDDAAGYQAGDVVKAELPDGTVVEEKITFISPVAEERLSTLGVNENRCRVELTADGVPKRMGPGYELTLRFEQELSGKTQMLPVSALVNENQETFVYVVENGKCKKTPVITGIYSGGMVEISSGLEKGAQVVENPASHDLKDGGTVEAELQ